MAHRSVHRLVDGHRDDIGDLVTRRPLPNDEREQLDPFLFLNHHGPQVYPPHNSGLPFGPHPHRGFETVTFIVEGSLMHRDTAGHESVIDAGGVQWMTAGRGLQHAELSPPSFLEKGGPLEILQLWVNLPSRLKMTEPRYVGLQRGDFPSCVADAGRVEVNVIAGSWMGNEGPVTSLTGLTLFSVAMRASGRITLAAPRAHNVFLYVVRGVVRVSGTEARAFQLVELNDDGDEVELEALAESLLLFGHGAPLREPVVAHGPFVMNTREEIVQAIRDYQSGKF